MDNHLNKCPKKAMVCKICKGSFLQADIPKHTATQHPDEAKNYLISCMTNMQNKNKPVKPESNHNYFDPVINKF